MSELVKCATCKTEKPFSEMQTCMRAEREHSVCDMNCMIKLYKGEIKPDTVVTPDLEEMVKLGMNPKEYHLHKENLELRAQLAKANEREKRLEKILQRYESEQLQPLKLRVKDLEHCCESQEKNLMRQCVFMEKTAEKLEHHREWRATASVLRRPTREAKQALNKFAIEKKIEALRKFEPISNAVANHWCDKEQKGYLWLHAEILAEIEKLEQLRKEQE